MFFCVKSCLAFSPAARLFFFSGATARLHGALARFGGNCTAVRTFHLLPVVLPLFSVLKWMWNIIENREKEDELWVRTEIKISFCIMRWTTSRREDENRCFPVPSLFRPPQLFPFGGCSTYGGSARTQTLPPKDMLPCVLLLSLLPLKKK
eukprot:RCo003425